MRLLAPPLNPVDTIHPRMLFVVVVIVVHAVLKLIDASNEAEGLFLAVIDTEVHFLVAHFRSPFALFDYIRSLS